MLKKIYKMALIVFFINVISLNVYAATENGELITQFYEPLVMILMDTTNTMQVGPLGSTASRYGADTTCQAVSPCASYSATATASCPVDCSRLAIAQRVIFNVLDYNSDGYIKSDDKENWKLQVGAAVYQWRHCTNSSYTVDTCPAANRSDNYYNKVADVNTDYQTIMCADSTSCSFSSLLAGSYSSTASLAEMQSNTLGAGTNTIQALGNVKTYFDGLNTGDNRCRDKYVILITDGTDNKAYYDGTSSTLSCVNAGASGKDCDANATHIWRRESVLKAEELATAGYKVFVVGFANGLQEYHTNTLNWMALWGDPASYDLTQTGLANQEVHTTATIRPSSIIAKRKVAATACSYSDSATIGATLCVYQSNPDKHYTDDLTDPLRYAGAISTFFAATNDPGYQSFSTFSAANRAFFASDPDSLSLALKSIFAAISANTSYTTASIPAIRDNDESFAYEASFESVTHDPFWIGHLKKYEIYTTSGENYAIGDINPTARWDAGALLKARDLGTSPRTIKTYKGGGLISFTAGADSNTVTAADLGVSTLTEATNIVAFVKGGDAAYTDEDARDKWRLGDMSNSSPLSIGTPNALFYDRWDSNKTTESQAFYKYREDNQRTSANGKRLILQGANDGQMHIFKTSDGSELWSFIPPNFLPKLKNIAHDTHPAVPLVSGVSLGHQYFVDGPASAAEIWIDGEATPRTLCQVVDSVLTCPGVDKDKSEWKTYFILSEGRGGRETLWSSSSSCDAGFSETYSNTYPYYCGYWAFDISNSLYGAPVFKWRVAANRYLGQPWTKMFIGRVRESNTEKWVGLIGGGYSGTVCTSGTCTDPEAKGKGFFVVKMSDGSILWSKTHADQSAMDYDLAANPAAIDTDGDGFMDLAYAPDTGGNVWRFKFCKAADDADPVDDACTTTDWTATKLFNNDSGHLLPIYTSVSAAKDSSGQLWIYFGTGDKTNPNEQKTHVVDSATVQLDERFVALKEDMSSTFTYSVLADLGAATGTGVFDPTSEAHIDLKGWYLRLTQRGEKILSDPLVFEKVIYFTSFVPRNPASDTCNDPGESWIYGVDYMTGAGVLTNDDGDIAKGKKLGDGMSPGITISRGNDGWNLYGFLTQGSPHIVKVGGTPKPSTANNTLIYWQDRRVR